MDIGDWPSRSAKEAKQGETYAVHLELFNRMSDIEDILNSINMHIFRILNLTFVVDYVSQDKKVNWRRTKRRNKRKVDKFDLLNFN